MKDNEQKRSRFYKVLWIMAACWLVIGGWWVVYAGISPTPFTYLPSLFKPQPTPTVTPFPSTVEFRGMWVTRFDWTTGTEPADPLKIDQIVADAASAGINAIFFQVRGAADAYYTPGLEPWAERVSGNYGQPPNPYWDPLAYFVEKAHAQGIQLHVYLNVYPVWDDCTTPPDENANPRPFYYQLRDAHGSTGNKPNGLQWTTNDELSCSTYWRATPASVFADNHLVAVATDIVTRYNVDGIHLDHIRYADIATSCDPVSESAAAIPCFTTPPTGYSSWEDWQRAQINGTVYKLYTQVLPHKPGLWLSAAVWPVYKDYWNWGVSEGYHNFYQDSQTWIQNSYIDSLSPMIYGTEAWAAPDRWQTLVSDFLAHNGGRYIVPGIGADYSDFGEIVTRINIARQLGTAGHALFSYGALQANGYFDDLRNGPYSQPATVPLIPWHN